MEVVEENRDMVVNPFRCDQIQLHDTRTDAVELLLLIRTVDTNKIILNISAKGVVPNESCNKEVDVFHTLVLHYPHRQESEKTTFVSPRTIGLQMCNFNAFIGLQRAHLIWKG